MKPMEQRPYILKPKYDTGDFCVVTVDASAFHAKNDGTGDAAPAIQAALNLCEEQGGGTVYLPEGRYALRSYLIIPRAVTLRGEWICPEKEPNAGRGTILMAYCGKNDPNGTAQITMMPCTGLKNITVYYPEQDPAAPIPYSDTVFQFISDSVTLENVTMVNTWQGFRCGPGGNELHTLKNVYFTPLNYGISMDRTTDIGRLQHYHISPRYWEQFTLTAESEPLTAAQSDALRTYMFQNTVGVFMARSDWEYSYDLHIEGCRAAIHITDSPAGAPNAQMSRLFIHNCDVAFELKRLNGIGVSVSDAVVTGDRPLKAGVWAQETYAADNVTLFNGVDFKAPFTHAVLHDGTGTLSFVNCTFGGFTDTAVVQHSGGLSLQQCTFAAGDHLALTDGIGGAQILGCTFEGGLRSAVSDKAKRELQFSDAPLGLPVIPRCGHTFCDRPIRPASDTLYYAPDFGVCTDPRIDNTRRLQKALDAAGETGGVVFIPGGWYRFDGTLNVPAGVELRGVFEVPSHTIGGGTVLRTFAGRRNEDATPFITLGEGAGVRGFVIQHSEQDPVEPVPYPWAVRGNGKNVYAVDVVFSNSWLGIDFATNPSDGHYISYVGGAPIRCGIFVGHCESDGWVENVQYNPHYWGRSNFESLCTYDFPTFWNKQIDYLDAIRVGDAANEHMLGNFVFGCHAGLQFVRQEGKGARALVIGHGSDGDEIGLAVQDCDKVDLINAELVAMQSPRDRIFVLAEENATGKVRLFNSLMWGPNDYAMTLKGGNIYCQQAHLQSARKRYLKVSGGEHRLDASYIAKNTDTVEMTGGRLALDTSMTPRRAEDRADCEPVLDVAVTGGDYAESFSWSK